MGTTNKYMFQNESTKLTGLRPAHSISFCITTILRKHGSPSDPRKHVFSSWVCGTFCHPDVTYSREYLFVKWLIFPLFRCWTTCWYKPGEESAINDVGQLTPRPGTPVCVRLGGGYDIWQVNDMPRPKIEKVSDFTHYFSKWPKFTF